MPTLTLSGQHWSRQNYFRVFSTFNGFMVASLVIVG